MLRLQNLNIIFSSKLASSMINVVKLRSQFERDAWCQFGGENNIGILFWGLSFYGEGRALHMFILQNLYTISSSKLPPAL